MTTKGSTMLRRQQHGEFHASPEHRHGLSGVLRRLLWRLGFDPLTVYERLRQVETEREHYKRWLHDAERRLQDAENRSSA